MKSLSGLLILPFCLTLTSSPAMADWKVDNAQSEFHFVTTKAGKPGTSATQEVQTFKKISGDVKDNGTIMVAVDLSSVETGIEIRNQRIKELLFHVADNPKATFTGNVDLADIKKLAPGAKKEVDLDGKITLGGTTQPVTAKLLVVKLTGNNLLVETRAPFIINAADFDIQAGVEAMRKIMGLDVLSSAAPVSFSIVLNN